MVDKQWDSSIKDFRELQQLRKWSQKKVKNDEKWSKSGFEKLPDRNLAADWQDRQKCFTSSRTENGPKMVENAVFEGVLSKWARKLDILDQIRHQKHEKSQKSQKWWKNEFLIKFAKMKIEKSSKCTKVYKSVYINAHMSLSQGFLMCTLSQFWVDFGPVLTKMKKVM